MSFLSTSENVGFSGIPQNISDASCATQFKMSSSSAVCGEINSFINDNSNDDQSYVDNYFHTKFKIDPNDLYTFHDSDVIAGEITVSHSEDNFVFSDSIDSKNKLLFDTPKQELDILGSLPNGSIKTETKEEVLTNGHYKPIAKHSKLTDVKTSHTKAHKVAKNQSQSVKEPSRSSCSNIGKQASAPSVKGPVANNSISSTSQSSTKTSINNVSTSSKPAPVPKTSGSVTFLDIFKREQGLIGDAAEGIKTEPGPPPPVYPIKAPAPVAFPKKIPSGKPASSAKSRRGRGPAVHEALQRIPQRAVPIPQRPWHAPGDELFDCGPLADARPYPLKLLDHSSSEDDDHMPNFGERMGCVEEGAAESRGTRLALRRAALRRQVAQASAALRLSHDHRRRRVLATVIKKQLASQPSSARLPTQTVNHLLAMRGMSSVLTSQERRLLRANGWSGGESLPSVKCAEDTCSETALPCAPYCFTHVTFTSGQRLYATCSAVFAGGGRCSQPLLPLSEHTPLCAEHAWKRDNYDKISREVKPRKVSRKRPCPSAPRRAKRRRRPQPLPPRPKQGHIGSSQSLTELNVCSNSSAYDSSEDTGIGGLSESEFVVTPADVHALEVEQVPPDDILDSEVLGQIPDEAFTEFFNQAEGGATFAESSELARALEAVLDERALDSLADSLPANVLAVHAATPRTKIQLPSVGVEMSSGVSS